MASRAHHFVLWARLARRMCCTCGLLELRNEVSQRAAKAPCRGKIDE